MRTMSVALCTLAVSILAMQGGCANPDRELRKKDTEFAADAAKRGPFSTTRPVGSAHEAPARAEVGYGLKRLSIVNLSNEDWSNVEVWVNRQYVCFLPRMEKGILKRIDFTMLYNDRGQHFPRDNATVRVEQVHLVKDGKVYPVKTQLSE